MSPFASTRFLGAWRPYQARVLDALSAHLADGRVHLVAPPGSGKTLLGLETAVRLGRPALVLTPTLALRDQWLARFAGLFASEATVSTDLAAPAALTVSTYQGLHAAARRDAGALAAGLRAVGVGTLVVDEAHHLRKAWWASLRALRSELGDVTTVALTATPPYDVPTAEWARYAAFCGPPDADIPVPELVRAGHLCPHLDLVRYARPASDEQAALDAFRAETHALLTDVLRGGLWTGALREHAWVADPEARADEIAGTDPDWFLAALSVLREATDLDVSPHAGALGLDVADVPALRTSELDRFLTGVLGTQSEAFGTVLGSGAAVRDLRRALDRLGALDGSRVSLQHPQRVRSALAASTSKIEAAVAVVGIEAASRGSALRAVVLADRIGEAALDAGRGEAALRALGVVPLFERLRSDLDLPVGVLTGRFAVLPAASLDAFRAACAVAQDVDTEPLDVAPGYVRVEAGEGSLVPPVTALFEAGAIRVLVGTVALLGEGWDAPAANVLVSASAAATFVQTGQVRGRVFRVDAGQPDKVASVWHLACLDAGDPSGGPDVDRLRRRFRAFVVPRPGRATGDPPRLETGLGPVPDRATLDAANEESARRAADRDGTRLLWRRALGDGVDGGALRPSVRLASGPRRLAGVRVRRYGWMAPSLPAASLGAAGLASGVSGALIGFGHVAGWSLGAAGLALVAWGGGAFFRDVARRSRRARSLGPAGRTVEAAARAVLDALRAAGEVVDPDAVAVTERTADGLEVRLDGALADADVLADALTDLFSPVDSPRYLLRVEGTTLAVPERLGGRKARAVAFAEAWHDRVGPATLVFTRTPAGRRVLAAARGRRDGEADVSRVRRWRPSR